jgi:glycosyltransferase involved in cell wall biosynthesis
VAERVKILHVITKFWAGAGGNTLLSAVGMDPTVFEVWVAGCEGGPLWSRAEAAGVRTVQLKRFTEVISPIRDVFVLVQLIRLIRRERFTIVHSHSSKGGVLGRLAAWLCRTPVIVHTFHGFSFHDFMSPLRRGAYLLMERSVRPMTDHVFAVAPAIAREAVEKHLARPEAVSVVPSAVELDRIPFGPDPTVRDELGIRPGEPIVGTVGRLDFQKAPLDFVRMAASVSAARPGARFVMVGDGSLEDAARAEARRLGVEILFTGFREDAARIACSFDVFVISSLYEGLGRSLTEALASGRPVVASAVNGVPDLVRPRETGLLAPPAEPQTLARAVIWMLDHPQEARSMGERGRAEVRSRFQPRIMCELLEQVYRALVGLPASERESGVNLMAPDVANEGSMVSAGAGDPAPVLGDEVLASRPSGGRDE